MPGFPTQFVGTPQTGGKLGAIGSRGGGEHGERPDGVGAVAGVGARGEDRGGGLSFAVGGAAIPVAGSVLSAHHHAGDHAVLTRRGAGGFLVAVCWYGAGSRGGWA